MWRDRSNKLSRPELSSLISGLLIILVERLPGAWRDRVVGTGEACTAANIAIKATGRNNHLEELKDTIGATNEVKQKIFAEEIKRRRRSWYHRISGFCFYSFSARLVGGALEKKGLESICNMRRMPQSSHRNRYEVLQKQSHQH